jgi:hypothetical protein
MKYLLLVYNDQRLVDQLPAGGADGMMRECFAHADGLRARGTLLDSEQLEAPATATSVRIRNGRVSTTDGPFAETREILGGFNLIEAESLEDAIRVAANIPWAKTGCIEVRPVRDQDAVREQVGADWVTRGDSVPPLTAAKPR